jgi:hypothetical protein
MLNDVYPRLSKLTYVAFEVNSLLETCDSKMVDFQYVYSGIEQKNLIQKFEIDFSDKVDFSNFTSEPQELEKLYTALLEVADGLKGQERRKLGVEKNGLNLLIAFILEIIQRQSHSK